jgi:hypothetical protein
VYYYCIQANAPHMENQRNYSWVWILIVIIVLVAGIFIYRSSSDDTYTGSPEATSTGSVTILPYGRATLSLGEEATFRGITIKPVSVLEDSRCPAGVQCIQAGTVRINVESQVGNTTRQDIVRLGSATTVDTFAVTLVSVLPATKAGSQIPSGDYIFTFDVHQSAVVDEELIGK